MTVEDLSAYREIGGAIAAIIGAGFLAWRARGRKDLSTPYSPEHGAQPRIITRDEWHGVVQLVNAWPGLSRRVKSAEGRLSALEEEFSEHLKATAQAMSAFARLETNFSAHVDRWEEVGVEAREHRQRMEAHILRIEEKVNRRADH